MGNSEELEQRIREIMQTTDLNNEDIVKTLRDLHFRLGREYLTQNNVEGAVKIFTEAARSFKISSAENYIEKGRDYFQNGDLDKALQEFQLATKTDPNSFDAFRNMAEITLFEKKNIVEGVRYYKKAFEVMPLPNSLLQFYSQAFDLPIPTILMMKERTKQLVAEGKPEEAHGTLLDYLKKNPLDEEAYLIGGMIWLDHLPQLAAEFGQGALEINPNNNGAHTIVVLAILNGKKYDTAVKYSQSLAAKYPDQSCYQHLVGFSIGQKLIDSAGMMGKLDQSNEEFQTAMKSLDQAVQLYQRYGGTFDLAETHAMRGELYLRAHNFYESAKAFTIAKKLGSPAGDQRVKELLNMKENPHIKKAISEGYLG